MKYKGYFDGAAQPTNPGPAGIGSLIMEREGKIYWQESLFIGHQTNNYAEYTALIKLLEVCVKNNLNNITIHGDSKLVINQMNHIYQVKSENIRPLYIKAQKLAQQIRNINFQWIPRKQNTMADNLSKRALMKANKQLFLYTNTQHNYST